MKFGVVEKISVAGSSEKVNEDAVGYAKDIAFVIDGATGLSDHVVFTNFGSDATWLAKFVADKLSQSTKAQTDSKAIISEVIDEARREFELAAQGLQLERYAWPTSSFVMIQLQNGQLVFSGLGDCNIYHDQSQSTQTFSPLQAYASIESSWAARHISNTGGFGTKRDLLTNPDTLKELRDARMLQNSSASGVWTLGLISEAADHLSTATVSISKEFHCLMCSDGFSALVDTYGAYTPDRLLRSAISRGLKPLLKELRNIENLVDPDGIKFPRFKRSDDASAILVRVSLAD